MPVNILYDSIRSPEFRQSIEQAVTAAVGNRSDKWKAWLDQGADEPGFSIRLDGPDGVGFSYRFLKPDERSPEFVNRQVKQAFHNLNGV